MGRALRSAPGIVGAFGMAAALLAGCVSAPDPEPVSNSSSLLAFVGSPPSDPRLQAQVEREVREAYPGDYTLTFDAHGRFTVSGFFEGRPYTIDDVLRFTGVRIRDLRYVRCPAGGCRLDYARILRDSGDDGRFRGAVANVTGERRQRAETILTMVQRMPYRVPEERFLTPARALSAGYGDCDTKSVLAAALLREAGIGDGVLFIEYDDHVNIAIDVAPDADDLTVRHDGRTYVVAEVAGPFTIPLGELDAKRRGDFLRGQATILPASFVR